MGVANNGVYLAWLEIARIEYLRSLGHSYRDVHDGGFDLVVAEAHVRYLKPLRFDDEFEIDCGCAAVTGATVTFDYELRPRPGCTPARRPGTPASTAPQMRPVRLPEWLRDGRHRRPADAAVVGAQEPARRRSSRTRSRSCACRARPP